MILVILFNKITICPFNDVIDSIKSNVLVTHFFTIFLQTIKIENSYWFTYMHNFLLINNLSPH